MTPDPRQARRHGTSRGDDDRRQFEVDRDRIQYSTAFHRLAGVTQIVRAGESGIFHTRQQHTYKVAQVGRRLAQRCVAKSTSLAVKLGVDPEVVEAAGLAHDLGHPPFGHAGEQELNYLVEYHGDPDGFEGNAQSFRILTKLAVRYPAVAGLDLTRATLASCLKYPWLRDTSMRDRTSKWGAYGVDEEDFIFARELHPHNRQSTEAALMDWADDISYSVHDLEDFHRVGAIPWAGVLASKVSIVQNTLKKWYDAPNGATGLLDTAFDGLSELIETAFGELLQSPYEGTRDERYTLRNLSSVLIGRFVNATSLTEEGHGVNVPIENVAEVKLLKQITKDYITSRPALIAQQRGQRRIVKELFEALYSSSDNAPPSFLPNKLTYLWDVSDGRKARFVADCISSLTESEVIALHSRIFGLTAGSVLDPIVR